MLGAIIGDIAGSAYEFHNYRAKDFQPFFHPKARFTDDTVCTIAIADALLKGGDPATTLRAWGRRYWSNGGWGKRFAFWLANEDMGPYGSLGNGGAMRVSPAGMLATSLDDAIALSNQVTAITHDHPEGMRGATATAVSIHLAMEGIPAADIRATVYERFGYDMRRSVDELRPGYGHSERAEDTVPHALTCAFASSDYEDAIRNAISIGGDSDTIAAIAGSVAEALHGIDDDIVRTAWSYLPEEMRGVLRDLYAAKRGKGWFHLRDLPEAPATEATRGTLDPTGNAPEPLKREPGETHREFSQRLHKVLIDGMRKNIR